MRKYILLLSALVLLFTALTSAQEVVPENMKVGFDSITSVQSLSHIEFLASDELEGRDTASQGMRIARNYAAAMFKQFGLAPAGELTRNVASYHQPFDLVVTTKRGEATLNVMGKFKTRSYGSSDITAMRGAFAGQIAGEVVFAGYGIEADDLNYNDLKDLDVKNKIVIVLGGAPNAKPFNDPANARRFSPYGKMRGLATTLSTKGASAVLMIMGSGGYSPSEYRQGSRISSPRRSMSVPALDSGSSVPVYVVSESLVELLMDSAGLNLDQIKSSIDKDIKPHSMLLKNVKVEIEYGGVESESVSSGNVLAMIEGSDPEMKNEYIVIGAHLDHEGMNEQKYVFNGADDNASGSAGVLEVAQAFALNPVAPKRSIVFALWTGEEKGLYGSNYYVAYPPIPEGGKIVANINMDMIGRDMTLAEVRGMARMFGANADEFKKEDLDRMVAGSVSSQVAGFYELMMDLNEKYLGLMVAGRATPSMSGGSDHAPFHAAKIPAFSFITGLHGDYHTPRDTAEKINPDKLAKIVQLAYLIAFHVGDMDKIPAWTESK